MIDTQARKERQPQLNKLRAAEQIANQLKQMRAADPRFDYLDQLRNAFDRLIGTKAILQNVKSRLTHVDSFGDFVETVNQLQGTIVWDQSLSSHFTADQLAQSIYSMPENSEEEKYYQRVYHLVEEQLPKLPQYIQETSERVAKISTEITQKFENIKTFIPLVIDELLAELGIEVTIDQRQKLELFVIDHTANWRIQVFQQGYEKTHSLISGNALRLPPYALLTPEEVTGDVDMVKHEVIHRMKMFDVISEDIQIPIATATGFLEYLINSDESTWHTMVPGIEDDFCSRIAIDIKLHDLDVIYVYYVMNETLSSSDEAPKKINAQKNFKPAEVEPLLSYEQGHRLAVMAMIVGKLSLETNNPITPQKFLAGLSKGKLPSEVYKF